ncbi:trichohyalin [Hyalella azteca]|uniref:Trichohyalin n=1 Tax=Hyalella azteca TaxID=294128 RepID=A0A979FRX9_HYAAZ|nr:trichohyalin [Hyalella azteca]
MFMLRKKKTTQPPAPTEWGTEASLASAEPAPEQDLAEYLRAKKSRQPADPDWDQARAKGLEKKRFRGERIHGADAVDLDENENDTNGEDTRDKKAGVSDDKNDDPRREGEKVNRKTEVDEDEKRRQRDAKEKREQEEKRRKEEVMRNDEEASRKAEEQRRKQEKENIKKKENEDEERKKKEKSDADRRAKEREDEKHKIKQKEDDDKKLKDEAEKRKREDEKRRKEEEERLKKQEDKPTNETEAEKKQREALERRRIYLLGVGNATRSDESKSKKKRGTTADNKEADQDTNKSSPVFDDGQINSNPSDEWLRIKEERRRIELERLEILRVEKEVQLREEKMRRDREEFEKQKREIEERLRKNVPNEKDKRDYEAEAEMARQRKMMEYEEMEKRRQAEEKKRREKQAQEKRLKEGERATGIMVSAGGRDLKRGDKGSISSGSGVGITGTTLPNAGAGGVLPSSANDGQDVSGEERRSRDRDRLSVGDRGARSESVPNNQNSSNGRPTNRGSSADGDKSMKSKARMYGVKAMLKEKEKEVQREKEHLKRMQRDIHDRKAIQKKGEVKKDERFDEFLTWLTNGKTEDLGQSKNYLIDSDSD